MNPLDFDEAFYRLTEKRPFPWQQDLYNTWFSKGKFPDACTLPTGLGKTSVVAIWLIAQTNYPNLVPRRLVYVVNRRTVVDQTTVEAERIRSNASAMDIPSPAISTLRGQFADNRDWSSDPSKPSIIVGTVDMIGSRLLFSGYGVGMKARPLHAGFLGQDVLLVHDEAHLEPAFQNLLEAIEREQKRCQEFRTFRVMALTATSRGEGEVFELTSGEKDIPDELSPEPTEPIHHVWQRMKSKKGLKFHAVKRDAVATTVGRLAREHQRKNSGQAILIFVRTLEDVKEVKAVLTNKKEGGVPEEQVQLLTGTLRGKERDDLATCDPVFARFRSPGNATEEQKTVYLICTSAGEVGIDISAQHMVCDLSTLDSMAQRFGRVNRRGEGKACIDVVLETDANPKPPSPAFEAARWRTREVLERLPACTWIDERYDASPAALGRVMKALSEAEREAAFAPSPTILPVTDILFDAWALTTIRGQLPGRPKVEPYLHGLADWQPPETQVAWRSEVERLQPENEADADRGALARFASDLLEDYPLEPHELLREPSNRAFKQFEAMAKRCPNLPAWLIDDHGNVQVLTITDLADKDEKGRIEGMTVLLPPSAGGLERGMLNGSARPPESGSLDVADECFTERGGTVRRRMRLDENHPPEGMRLIRRVPLPGGGEETDPDYWYWFERGNEGGTSARDAVEWSVHVQDVQDCMAAIAGRLPLDEGLRRALQVVAKFHDHGKRRKLFQIVLGNPNYRPGPGGLVLAKSGSKGGRVEERYRHEFGSLLDVEKEAEFLELTNDEKDLVRHLIATHHGRARPHFPAEEAFDPEYPSVQAEGIAREVPRRFARLQRKYGRWGLAYLESLFRAADWMASANPSKCLAEGEQ